MAIARVLLDKFHPMHHVDHSQHPLCWCGTRHKNFGEDIYVYHQGRFINQEPTCHFPSTTKEKAKK